MIALDATTKSLEIKLAGAVTTNQLPFVSSYVDISQSLFSMSAAGEQDGVTNNTTAVTILSAPAATTTRKLNFLSVSNIDTAAATVTIQYDNGGTLRIVVKITLQVGDQLAYIDSEGWYVIDTNGNIKFSTNIAANSVTLAMLQQIGTASVLGRNTAGTGNVEVLTTIPAGTLAGRSLADLGTRAVANLSDGSNVALLNAADAFTDTTDASSSTTGALKTAGGVGIAKKLYVGTDANIGGVLTVSGFGTHTFSASGVGPNQIAINNPSNNAASYSAISLGTDAGGGVMVMRALSIGSTFGGISPANGGILEVVTAGGLVMGATHTSGTLRFYTGGTTLRATLGTGGLWQWNAYGAGTLTTDASGNITAVSDERLKNIQGNYTGGLKEILAITPIRYKYIYGSGLDTYNTYVGFPAKAVESYIPEAVGENAEGKLSFSDRPIIATLVNAVKELQDQIDTLKAALNLTPFDRTIAPKTTGKIRRMV